MSKSVRLTNTIPAELYERLEKHAESNGVSVTQALIALIITQTKKLHDDPTPAQVKPIDPQKRYADLMKRIKPYVEKVNDETITRRELVQMDTISKEICEVKTLLGMTSSYVDRVELFDRNRASAQETITHMESELNELQTYSRHTPLDQSDLYRVKELMNLITQRKRELDEDYPLE